MTDDAEVIELRKKIAQAEKRLSENERLLSESKQRTAETKQRLANLEKAKAALMKFYARGPHTKKKSGRPGFWVTPDGCSFVWEVERFKKKRKCKTAFAIIQVRKKTIRSANQLKARGIKSPIIARAARLERLANDASLRRGYEDARRFWLFMVDPEAYRHAPRERAQACRHCCRHQKQAKPRSLATPSWIGAATGSVRSRTR
jgi:hypothetical protein